jgi:hypothetical protein
MNWMIDGLYGDLYRTAMGYRALTLWATERAALHLAGTQVSAKERTAS